MKKLIITIAFLLLSILSFGNNIEPVTEWNNKGKALTFKKGDTVLIKKGSNASKYVVTGKVEFVCNSQYIKVNGYFVQIQDVEVITKYNTVK